MRVPILVLVTLVAASCSPLGATPETIRTRVTALAKGGGAVHDERLRHPKTVTRFYEARRMQPAWNGKAKRVVEAIRAVERDGLDPADYHLKAIEALIEDRPTREAATDLEVLLTDAVAGVIDHVRYGRVRPVAINPAWNVDPREEAAPLEQSVEDVARAGSPEQGIEQQKPQHFIYQGLVGALERLRKIEAAGGWPSVPPGKSIEPGATSARVPAVRARMVHGGELPAGRVADSTRYDPALVRAVKQFQEHHRLTPDGIVDKATVEAMNVPVRARIGQVRVNLERARWVLSGLEGDFLLVNLPAFKAYLIQGGKNVWETRIQIGDEARRTPSFRSRLETVVLNPDWTVPPTILEKDVIEGMRKGENTVARKGLLVLDGEGHEIDPASIDWGSATAADFPYTLRQPPGDDNALGQVKFLFPNRYSIYLHDTPHRELFEAEDRTFSSGCIRVEKPLELADRLLSGQWNSGRIRRALEDEETEYVKLQRPLPIVIVYWTVSVGATGEIRYMKDFYEQDGPVLAAMGRRG